MKSAPLLPQRTGVEGREGGRRQSAPLVAQDGGVEGVGGGVFGM